MLYYMLENILNLTIVIKGNRRETQRPPRRHENPGECTLHARECGAGTSIFFLVEKCSVLLLSGQFSCFAPSLYVDTHGNSKSIAGQNKPLHLSTQRYDKVKYIYTHHHTIRYDKMFLPFLIPLNYMPFDLSAAQGNRSHKD